MVKAKNPPWSKFVLNNVADGHVKSDHRYLRTKRVA
jgi:hypothetical protein